MNVLVVVAHPNKESFNHAIARATVTALQENGHTVIFRDLHEEGFDPILPAAEIPKVAALEQGLEEHCADLSNADGIVIVHPNWWGQPPAILKGWVDRAFRPGVAYEFLDGDSGAGVPVGLLRAKTAVVFNTSNTPQKRELQAFGDPLETLWKNCIFGLCGVHNFYRRTFGVIVTSTPEQRQAWLAEACDKIKELFPVAKGQ
jgi:putative NADPH-quinone reductase